MNILKTAKALGLTVPNRLLLGRPVHQVILANGRLWRNVDYRHICARWAHGRELTYLEGWYAISEANRIFGFDGWSRETTESRCVLARENKGTFLLTVRAKGSSVNNG